MTHLSCYKINVILSHDTKYFVLNDMVNKMKVLCIFSLSIFLHDVMFYIILIPTNTTSIFRDLKPENILLDDHGKCKLSYQDL